VVLAPFSTIKSPPPSDFQEKEKAVENDEFLIFPLIFAFCRLGKKKVKQTPTIAS
jgi:hypothetical protein